MGAKTRREKQKENLRQEILDAARELFAKEGYESVSMRKIAEKIDYSPTTIYLHFEDKADLLFHICEETFAKLMKVDQKVLAEDTDPLTKVKKIGRAYVDFGLKHPYHYQLTFMVPREYTHKMSPEDYQKEGLGFRAFDVVKSCVEECIKKGIFRKIDANVASQVLWAGVHGITSLLIAKTLFPWVDKDKTIDTLIDSVIEGLKKK